MMMIGPYRILATLGKGSFGTVYHGIRPETGQEVAIKLEETACEYPQLKHECRAYKALWGGPGIPKLYWCGATPTGFAVAMDKLGSSLKALQEARGGVFSLKTTLMLADQILHRIHFIHSRGYTYRDVKPDNFIMDAAGTSVYVVDFGLATRFREEYSEGKNSFAGTTRYASVHAHRCRTPSFRDDMESVGYMLVYMAKGLLPWQGIQASSPEERMELVANMKESIEPEQLCSGLPEEFTRYMKYCKGLEFESVPDYTMVRQWFYEAFLRLGYVLDNVFDWSPAPMPPPSLVPDPSVGAIAPPRRRRAKADPKPRARRTKKAKEEKTEEDPKPKTRRTKAKGRAKKA